MQFNLAILLNTLPSLILLLFIFTFIPYFRVLYLHKILLL